MSEEISLRYCVSRHNIKLKWFSTFVILSRKYNLLQLFGVVRTEQDFPLV